MVLQSRGFRRARYPPVADGSTVALTHYFTAATLRVMASPALGTTLASLLDHSVKSYKDNDLIVHEGEALSFAQVRERVDVLARVLIAEGICAGDRVGLWAPNSTRWLVAALATWRVGAVLVPLNTRFRGHEAAYVLENAAVHLLFTTTDFLGADYPAMLRAADPAGMPSRIVIMSGPADDGDIGWTEFLARAEEVPSAAVAERVAAVEGDDVGLLMFTSGTTGAPRGAMIRHAAVVRCFDSWSNAVDMREGDRQLVVIPFFTGFGLLPGVLSALIRGMCLVPQATLVGEALVEAVGRHQITVLCGPPSVFQTILDLPPEVRGGISTVRLSVTGSANVPVELIRQMREVLGIESVLTGYGLTEASGVVSVSRSDDLAETVATTAGQPIPGVEVRVTAERDDGSLELVTQPGVAGELWVRGYNVMAGYWNDPEGTAAVIDADGWLATGDIARVDERGYITITDRKKDMVIVGGFNVYPAELEGVMAQHPGIVSAAVIGVPDRRLGEVTMAFVVPRSTATFDGDAFRAWCRERMANFKVPRYVRVVDELPLSASGKVLKGELREWAGRG